MMKCVKMMKCAVCAEIMRYSRNCREIMYSFGENSRCLIAVSSVPQKLLRWQLSVVSIFSRWRCENLTETLRAR